MALDATTQENLKTEMSRVGILLSRARGTRAFAHFQDVIANPYKFHQKFGCCGFAAVLMAMGNSSRARIEDLAKTAFSTSDDPISRGFHRTGRLGEITKRPSPVHAAAGRPVPIVKRLRWRSEIEEWNDHAEIPGDGQPDLYLSITLMIFFKEYLKSDPAKIAIWNDCLTYSRAFGYWKQISAPARGRKDHHADAGFGRHMSQKQGDLAMTEGAMRELIRFAFAHIFPAASARTADASSPFEAEIDSQDLIALVHGGRAAFATTLETAYTDAANAMTAAERPDFVTWFEGDADLSKTVATYWRRTRVAALPSVAASFNRWSAGIFAMNRLSFDAFWRGYRKYKTEAGDDFLGVVLGLADANEIGRRKPGIGDQAIQNYIVHWVFVPQNLPFAAPSELEIWTWGKKHYLQVKGSVHTRDFDTMAMPMPRSDDTAIDLRFIPVQAIYIRRPRPGGRRTSVPPGTR